MAYPPIVQQFVVKPSANEREAPYIERDIDATRQAYGLRRQSTTSAYASTSGTSTASPQAVAQRHGDHPERPAARPANVAETFTARQQIRNVYGFPEKLDIDRYTVDGETQDYVVAVRELNPRG